MARAEQLAGIFGARAYPSLEAMLADPDVEIVHLSTPPYLHGPQGQAVIAAGKHLLCEKPLALGVEEGRALIDAARHKGVQLTVNYVMRHNPFWRASAALARSGLLGALRHMDLANHAAGLSLPPDHWFWDKAQSGGIWVEHGVHFFDAFAWMAGTSGLVLGATEYTRADGATDRVEALLRYGHTAAHCYHAFDQSGQTEQTTVTLTFERAYITLREWVPTSLELLTGIPPETFAGMLPGVVEVSTLPTGQHRLFAYAPQGKSALYRASIAGVMGDLAQAVRDPSFELPVTGHLGLDSLRTAVAAECGGSASVTLERTIHPQVVGWACRLFSPVNDP